MLICVGSTFNRLIHLQKPHVDYPYWDISNQPENWPGVMKSVPNSGFPLLLNMQVAQSGRVYDPSQNLKKCQTFWQAIVMLDHFTVENGATAVRPGSHLKPGPLNSTEFFEDYVQVEGTYWNLVYIRRLMT